MQILTENTGMISLRYSVCVPEVRSHGQPFSSLRSLQFGIRSQTLIRSIQEPSETQVNCPGPHTKISLIYLYI